MVLPPIHFVFQYDGCGTRMVLPPNLFRIRLVDRGMAVWEDTRERSACELRHGVTPDCGVGWAGALYRGGLGRAGRLYRGGLGRSPPGWMAPAQGAVQQTYSCWWADGYESSVHQQGKMVQCSMG